MDQILVLLMLAYVLLWVAYLVLARFKIRPSRRTFDRINLLFALLFAPVFALSVGPRLFTYVGDVIRQMLLRQPTMEDALNLLVIAWGLLLVAYFALGLFETVLSRRTRAWIKLLLYVLPSLAILPALVDVIRQMLLGRLTWDNIGALLGFGWILSLAAYAVVVHFKIVLSRRTRGWLKPLFTLWAGLTILFVLLDFIGTVLAGD